MKILPKFVLSLISMPLSAITAAMIVGLALGVSHTLSLAAGFYFEISKSLIVYSCISFSFIILIGVNFLIWICQPLVLDL